MLELKNPRQLGRDFRSIQTMGIPNVDYQKLRRDHPLQDV